MEKVINKLKNLDEKDFLKEIQKKEIPSLAISYFAVQEKGQGNVIKRWYAKAELLQREHKNIEKQINIAKWAAIFSAISSVSSLLVIFIR